MKNVYLFLLCGLFCAATMTANAQTWPCGDNVSAALDANGVMTISGMGAMYDDLDAAPWYDLSSQIKEVIINAGVTSIGDRAFAYCSSIVSLTIPNTVTEIGEGALDYTGLTKVINYAETPQAISAAMFEDLPFTTGSRLYVPASAIEYYNTATGWELFEKIVAIGESETWNVSAVGSNVTAALGAYGVLTISGSGAMADYVITSINNRPPWYGINDHIKEVIIESGVTTIGNYAFTQSRSGYPSLIKVTIGNSVSIIGRNTFARCESLATVNIPNSVISIGGGAFANCTSLTAITIGNSVQTIGDNTFNGCTSLSTVSIPNSITTIGESAFSGCISLTEVNIPGSVASIGDMAFNAGFDAMSMALTAINVDPNNPNYSSADGVLFNKNKSRLIQYPLGNVRPTYTIPSTVTAIEDYAFQYCTFLTGLTIPEMVTAIGLVAFADCPSLTTVTNHAVSPQVITDLDVFNNTSIATLQVPASAVAAYEAADVWGDFENIEAIGGSSAQTWDCGDGGNNVMASLANGVLTISGMGAMADYTSSSSPWFPARDQIQTVNITSGVTTIGDYAFEGCTSLTAVSIPSSVTIIGDIAFANTALSTISIPNSVATISSYAFQGASLTTISIPSSVTTIGEDAFSVCESLTAIDVAAGNPNYSSADGVLFNKAGTTLIVYPIGNPRTAYSIPNGVTTISEGAFIYSNRSTALTSLTIPSSVATIGAYAFWGCNSLTELINHATTPQTITTSMLGGISTYTCKLYVPAASFTLYEAATVWKNFRNIASIGGEAVTWPCGDAGNNVTASLDGNGVLTISGTGAMADYTYMTGSRAPWYNLLRNQIQTVNITQGVTSIGSYAFEMCTALTSISISSSVTAIGESALYYCIALTTIDVAADNNYLSSDDDVLFNKSKTTLIQHPIGKFATSYTIPGTVTTIGANAFASHVSLASITIPSSVNTIGEGAFYFCPDLTAVIIPGSVTTIGANAFQDCGALTEVNIPSSVTTIGSMAFSGGIQGSMALTAINIDPNNPNYSSVEGVLFNKDKTVLIQYPSGNTSSAYTIPSSVTAIGSAAFQYSKSLTEVTIPSTVSTIEDLVFSGCTSLTKVTNYAETPQEVSSNGFFSYEALTKSTLYVPASAVGAYQEAFMWNDFANIEAIGSTAGPCTNPIASGTTGNLTWTLCPDGVLTISGEGEMPDYTIGKAPWYSNRKSITSVVMEEGVTSIGNYAFEYSNVMSVTIPNSVTSIEDYAFYNCPNLTSVTIPGSVTSIGVYAFADCTGLTSVTIPESVTSIDFAAFASCTALTSVTIHNSLTAIGDYAFADCSSLTEVVNHATTPQVITANVFLNVNTSTCTLRVPAESVDAYRNADVWRDFANIITPSDCITGTTGTLTWTLCEDGVLTISGEGAMPDYSSTMSEPWFSVRDQIKEVIIETGITSIGNHAFDGCFSLAAVSIPASVTTIGNQAFLDCRSITAVTIPASVTTVGNFAFFKCFSLTAINVATDNPAYSSADGVLFNKAKTALIQYPVGNTRTAYTIPNPVSIIWVDAFAGCTSLTSLTIPNSVATIEEWAFISCQSLTTVINHAAIPQVITAGVFSDVAITNATLRVPAESVDAYRSATVWKDFGTIVAIEDIIPVTDVTLNMAEMTLLTGAQATLIATVTPAEANPAVTWSSSNPAVATVNSEGHVTGIAAGTSVITATASDGITAKSCTVKVISGTGTIDGTVVKKMIEELIIRIILYIREGSWTWSVMQKAAVTDGYIRVADTYADASGYYRFDNLPEGDYIVVVETEEYESTPSDPISLAAGETANDVNFTLEGNTIVPDDDITGTGEIFAPDLKAYPNPFTDAVRITGADGCTLRVVNAAGIVVHTRNIESPDETIRLEYLPQGMYFLRLEKSGRAKTVKVMKQQ